MHVPRKENKAVDVDNAVRYEAGAAEQQARKRETMNDN